MNKEIGKTIKVIRELHSFTENEVASALGISKERFIGIEKGVYTPTLNILAKLSELFNIPVKNLTKDSKPISFKENQATNSTKEMLAMINLFYANKNLYEKLIYQKQKRK